jgi:hypothetical protein
VSAYGSHVVKALRLGPMTGEHGAAIHPPFRDRHVLGFPFNPHELAQLVATGHAGRTAAGKRVEHGAADWRDELHQPPHQLDGLHGRMEIATRLQPSVAGVVATGIAFLA